MAKKELICKHCLRGTFNTDEVCANCKQTLAHNPHMAPPEDDETPPELRPKQ